MSDITSIEPVENSEFCIDSFILELLSDSNVSVSNDGGSTVETVGRESIDTCESVNVSAVAPSVSDIDTSSRVVQEFPWNSSPISHYEPSLRTNLSTQRLLGLRTVEIEERMGIFQFALWKIPLAGSEEVLCNLVNDISGNSFKYEEFKAISKLDFRRRGVLMRVSSLVLKHLIFTHRSSFRSRGYELDLF